MAGTAGQKSILRERFAMRDNEPDMDENRRWMASDPWSDGLGEGAMALT